MKRGDFPPWVLVVLLGSVTFVMLHIHFVTAWEDLYLVAPWAGFEAAAREGVLGPWFGSTPRSLRVTQTVLFVLAGVLGVMRAGEGMKTAVGLWIGVLLPLIPVLVARAVTSKTGLITVTPMSDQPMTWMALPLEGLRTATPIFLGVLAGLLVRRVAGILST